MSTFDRSYLKPIAGPILGEIFLGYTVALIGLWLASLVSVNAVGSFGLAVQVLETVYVVYRVLNVGIGVVITQLLGGKQMDRARKSALAALGICTWEGLVVASVLYAGSDVILRLLNAPEEVRVLARPYLQLLAPAAMFEAYNQTLAAILRANLYVRDSLRVVITVHCTHIALTVPLMFGVGTWDGMGLNGYAVALFISRVVGALLHLFLWRRRMDLVPRVRDWWTLRRSVLRPILRIGVPGASADLGYRMFFMVSVASASRLGVVALATLVYVLQLLRYVVLISLAIGLACETMVGHLVGAGRLRDAHLLVRKGVRNGLIASSTMSILAAATATSIMRVFTNDPTVIQAAQTLLWIAVLLEIGRVLNLVITGALRATGDAIYPVAASMGSFALVLGLGSFLLSNAFGLPGIFVAYAADEWLRGLLMFVRWNRGGWLPHARTSLLRVRGLEATGGVSEHVVKIR